MTALRRQALPVGDLPVVYVHPGDVVACPEPRTVTMVLGSCVGMCLWDARARVGGANHFALPQALAEVNPYRFGPPAFARLVEFLVAAGASPRRLQAKVFGGASPMAGLGHRTGALGARNVEVAHELLEAAGIPLVSEDVLGPSGRRVVFHSDTGEAWSRLLGN